MIKLQKETVDVGATNTYYRKNYINNSAFAAAKKVFAKARKNRYIPFSPIMESVNNFEQEMRSLHDVLLAELEKDLPGEVVTDYTEFDSEYTILWFGLESDGRFEININVTPQIGRLRFFINRVFLRRFRSKGIMSHLIQRIIEVMQENRTGFYFELEDWSAELPDGRTVWRHLFDKFPRVKVNYLD